MDNTTDGALGVDLLNDADHIGLRCGIRTENPDRRTSGSEKINYMGCLWFVGTGSRNKGKVSRTAFHHEASQTTAQTTETPNQKVAGIRGEGQAWRLGNDLCEIRLSAASLDPINGRTADLLVQGSHGSGTWPHRS